MENLYRAIASASTFDINGGIESIAEKYLADNIKTIHARSKFSLNLKSLKAFVNG